MPLLAPLFGPSLPENSKGQKLICGVFGGPFKAYLKALAPHWILPLQEAVPVAENGLAWG
jgi:hypothetical protein